MASKKTAKQVQVVARYSHKTNGKLNGTVTYLVRASNGVDTYCTTLVDGKATGCSCPASRGKCYHKTQLETREQERASIATQFAAKHAPLWLVNMVRSTQVRVAPQVVVMPTQAVASKCEPDISTRGNLNGQRGFSLLRTA